jgi:hypothetical protein
MSQIGYWERADGAIPPKTIRPIQKKQPSVIDHISLRKFERRGDKLGQRSSYWSKLHSAIGHFLFVPKLRTPHILVGRAIM